MLFFFKADPKEGKKGKTGTRSSILMNQSQKVGSWKERKERRKSPVISFASRRWEKKGGKIRTISTMSALLTVEKKNRLREEASERTPSPAGKKGKKGGKGERVPLDY